MLNVKNWWTDKVVNYDYKEDLDARIEEAANLIWDGWFSDIVEARPSHLKDVISQAMQIINTPGGDPRKFL